MRVGLRAQLVVEDDNLNSLVLSQCEQGRVCLLGTNYMQGK